MIKFFVFAIVGLCAALFATAANQCYVTPIRDLKDGNFNNIVIQNCSQYIKLKSARRNVPIYCFTMPVKGPQYKFIVRGCILKGECNTAKKKVMDIIRENGLDGHSRVICSECYGDNCNGNYLENQI